jgi:hypothetical protein
MRYFFSIVIFLHGAIHMLGFVKGFHLAHVENLSSDISRIGGLSWLLAFILFTAAGIGYFLENNTWPYLALPAVIVSCILIMGVWADARWGMVPNVIIAVVALVGFSSCSMNQMIARETALVEDMVIHTDAKIITETDTEHLPSPVRRWLLACGMVGRQEIASVWSKQNALMKMKPEQKEWYTATAEQLAVMHTPAFIWTVRLTMSPVIKVRGRDKYIDGKGQMLIRVNSLINVVNEKGEKLDQGTLQRFLGELVWYPSFALSPYIEWEAIDEYSAKATMSYNGVTGSGTFYFNKQGDFTRFVAMRYQGNNADSKLFPWEITVSDYAVFDGIKVPSKMEATWHLDQGPWTWLKLQVAELRYDY